MRILGVIHKDDGSMYGISFPDFAGCVSAGETIEQARANGLDALAFHLEGMAEDGSPMPTPMGYDKLNAHPLAKDAALITELDIALPVRAQRINLTVREDYLASIDRIAEQLGVNRSEFMVKAALHVVRASSLHNNDVPGFHYLTAQGTGDADYNSFVHISTNGDSKPSAVERVHRSAQSGKCIPKAKGKKSPAKVQYSD